MKERNLLAGFASIDDAQQAEKALKQAGFKETQVDRISPYPGEGTQKLVNPITGDIPGLPHMTLDADFSSNTTSILAATDVSASGLSDGDGPKPEVNRSILLTAVVPDKQADQAMQIIRNNGGII